MNRIPLVAVQEELVAILKKYQTTAVYDDLPEMPAFPCITFGGFTCKSNGAKGSDVADVSIQLQIWSEYSGKMEVNEVANDISEVFSKVGLDLERFGFSCLSQQVDFFESFPEEDEGYRGIMTLVFKIQNMEGSAINASA